MIAVDTNIVLRLLVADDPDQTGRAQRLFDRHEILISSTVLLECEWVLRTGYKLTVRTIQDMFERLCGLPRVSLTEPEAVSSALLAYAQGLDFADALHVASSRQAKRFATFDRALIKASKRAVDLIEVFEPGDA